MTGAHIWNFSTGGWAGSPAVVSSKVYVGSWDAQIYCLDASTGAHIWNYTTGQLLDSSPAVVDGKVFVGSIDKNVYCLDALTGTHVWNYTTEGLVWSSPAVANGKVFVGSFDNNVYCLDDLTGALIWSYTTGGDIWSSPAVADGVVYAGSSDGTVYAFGTVIRVPEDYPTVQEAIDAAEGTTILIAPGVYHENLVINKTLTILGKSGSSPIFDGGGSGIAVILLPGASGSTVSNLVITNYDQGILIDGSCNCQIYNNIMSSNSIAINSTDLSTTNTICANIISENEIGINMTNSNGNMIYYNSFINNNIQAISSLSPNSWDNGYPDGGNYWSTHATTDILSGPDQDEPGSDGIVDLNYTITPNNIDRYPLAKPYSLHDIGITNVITSKIVVGQGFALFIKLDLLNYGTYSETFTITIYADTEIITTQPATLEARGFTTLIFEWSTSGFTKGNYTINAAASVVYEEVSTEDNMMSDGWVLISIIGDITGPDGWPDGKCDMRDVGLVARHFGQTVPDAPVNCDLTGPVIGVPDGVVDMRDIGTVARHFGEVDP